MFFTFKVRFSEVVAAVMTLTSCCQSSGVTILLVTFSTPAYRVSNKMPFLNFAKFTHSREYLAEKFATLEPFLSYCTNNFAKILAKKNSFNPTAGCSTITSRHNIYNHNKQTSW
jgi:hypothetical protein